MRQGALSIGAKKKPSEKEVILEEYVDCLHFILSIGLDGGFTDLSMTSEEPKVPLVQGFQQVFTEIIHFKNHMNEKNYKTLWNYFMALGQALGFTLEEIEAAYLLKNQINHQRQAEGY